MRVGLGIAAFCLLLPACRPQQTEAPNTEATPPQSRVIPWDLPTGAGAASPDLRIAPDGRLLLGWLQADGKEAHRFVFATADAKGTWLHEPRVIAGDSPLFANWADTPHLIATADGALWAHWLQRTGKGGGTYDVVLARSLDQGRSWSADVTVNDDGTGTEHGFATLWPEGRDRIGIAWLDGRNTAGHDHHGGGRMTLRTATFDGSLARSDERELDASTCDCCQTTSTVIAGVPMLAWRDRSDDGIRDIVIARREGGTWQAEQPVHADNWHIAGCPVNGPSLTAHDGRVLIGWYTGAGDVPRVRIAMGDGKVFGAMHEVETGPAVLGRVAVALDAKQAWVAWLQETDGRQSLMLARYAPDLGREIERIEVAGLQSRGRASGFPKLVSDGRTASLVWTDVENGTTVLRGARIRAD